MSSSNIDSGSCSSPWDEAGLPAVTAGSCKGRAAYHVDCPRQQGLQQGIVQIGGDDGLTNLVTEAVLPPGSRRPPSAAPADVPWLFLAVPPPSEAWSMGRAAAARGEAAQLGLVPGITPSGSSRAAAALGMTPAMVAAGMAGTAVAEEGAGVAKTAGTAVASGLCGAADVVGAPWVVEEGAGATVTANTAAAAAGPAPEAIPGISACFPGPCTLSQLLVMLELLLIFCPNQQAPRPVFWDCVLLLVGLLQQSSVEVRQQLMEQRGSLLLQLLYRVLREDEGLGGDGIQAYELGSHGVVSKAAAEAVVADWVEMEQTGEEQGPELGERIALCLSGAVGVHHCNPSVHGLVLMVLQSLVYEPLSLDLARVPVEQLQGMIILPRGKAPHLGFEIAT